MRFHIPITQLSKVIFALSFTAIVFGISPSSLVGAQDKNPVNMLQFDRLTASSGWLLLDQQLFWTSDKGHNWSEIGPLIPIGASVQDVEFIDADTGWMLWSAPVPDGSTSFELAHTPDHGKTWAAHPLSLFESGEVASYAEKAEMGWFDAQTGWISVKQATSSNFSVGTLFITLDGGSTWSRKTLPAADQISFSDPQVGWAAGGPTEDQVFQTQDAGSTWQPIHVDKTSEDHLMTAYMPFYSEGQGLLVTTDLGLENSLEVYSLDNSSEAWLPVHRVTLDAELGMIGLSILDSQSFVATIPGTSLVIRMLDGKLHLLENQDGLSASIVELDMVSPEIGWAKSDISNCVTEFLSDDQNASISCSTSTGLLHTTDGGLTWQTVHLPFPSESARPGILSRSQTTETISVSNVGNSQVLVGQGFDKCEIPTLSQMQTWWNSSPYKAVNLYIGGSSRACDNNSLTSSYLFRLDQQGWNFIPTWVGPQAPCTGYVSRMSSDPATAFNQGVAEANLAVESLAALGLTYPDKTGSVVYYDIEPYGTNTSCRNAVNSFMNGWVSQIRAHGSLAGVYGSTLCDTGLSDFLNITNVPDVIWPARWYHNLGSGYYDPNANVWNLGSCIPNTVWSNHQRIRQYEGDHNETWGGLTLAIDSNVLDGVVAVLHDYPFVNSIVLANLNPTNAAIVGLTVNFSESVTGVNKGDFVLTSGITDASIQSVSGSGATYVVTVNTGSSSGTIRLDVMDNNTIMDNANNPLGGIGNGDGNYANGEVYTINKGDAVDTTGVFRPSNGALYLKNSNTSGFADVQINYGLAGDYPVVGDWDGDGDVTIGIYRNGSFYLRNSNTIGFADIVFPFGAPGDQPIAGDWNNDGIDTIGVYRSSNGTFFLRNSNTFGAPDMIFALGIPGDVGITGDWNGDGIDTTGVFRPSNGVIFLKNTNITGFADIALNYGLPGDSPVMGDWNNDGIDTIGVYRNGQFMLRNSNTIGFADIVFALGIPGDHPIAGNWDGLP